MQSALVSLLRKGRIDRYIIWSVRISFGPLKSPDRVMLGQIVLDEASRQFKSPSHQQLRVFIPSNQCARPGRECSTVEN